MPNNSISSWFGTYGHSDIDTLMSLVLVKIELAAAGAIIVRGNRYWPALIKNVLPTNNNNNVNQVSSVKN